MNQGHLLVHVEPIDTTKPEIRKVKVKEIRRRKDLSLKRSKENPRDLSESSVFLNMKIREVLS